jgi:hypothetical protein
MGGQGEGRVSIDYITSQGNKNLLTIAAEAQARSGHDILAFLTWQPADHANRLEPVDDIMTELVKQNGKVNPTVEYLAAPTATGRRAGLRGKSDQRPMLAHRPHEAARGHRRAGAYPAGSPPKAEAWTLDAMLKAAEACHKGGHPFGIGLGVTEDNVDMPARSSSPSAPTWSTPRATSRSRLMRAAGARILQEAGAGLPPDAPAWDNASNNKYRSPARAR